MSSRLPPLGKDGPHWSSDDARPVPWCCCPGGHFLMGTEAADAYAQDGEGPVHAVQIDPFWVDRYAVSNARFLAFVAATGYVTEAEQFGWAFVFAGLLPGRLPADPPRRAGARGGGKCTARTGGIRRGRSRRLATASTTRWCMSRGTTRRAYCRWAGDASADRGRVGVRGARRPGAAPLPVGRRPRRPDGAHRMNVWQGAFPAATRAPTAISARRPSTRFRPTATGSTT